MKANKFTMWVKAHKKELLIVGGVAATAVGTILLIENQDVIKSFLSEEMKKSLPNSFYKPQITHPIENEPIVKIIDVREHLRNLPQGHHPSTNKLTEAARGGIKLSENQTLVSAHLRCYAA